MKLSALYHFRISQAWLTPEFLLRPLGKAGNNQTFNNLFTTPDLIKVKEIGPIKEIIGNYTARELKFITTEGKSRKVVFVKVDDYKENHGVVRVMDNGKHCYLFRIVDVNTFEVYISENNGHVTAQIFMMLCDGYLDAEIELLRAKINNANVSTPVNVPSTTIY